ncbi:hypothetical protein RND71_004193 [Anisodus tanguticus]|uniref:Uncharacterized protein n=1 Tax=Anisodus tanguticus TaxID=243964 RepID=A0AAE1SZ78_9SOLA|nr:hypothetical protein RND71_004193 [Anisodus tanguticus]
MSSPAPALVDVCGTTVANRAVKVKSVDGIRKITAVGDGFAMINPTAAAITHVLNNKQEFPFANGVEDLLVISLGNGESDSGTGNVTSSPAKFVKIAGDAAADMVDQAVSMAFGAFRNKECGIYIVSRELEIFVGELIKEEEMTKTSILPPVVLKQ